MPVRAPKDRTAKSIQADAFNADTLFAHRLKILIVVIVFLFGSVWINLYSIQVLRTEEYDQKLEAFTKSYLNLPSQRGIIFDRNGNVLVSNQERLSIMYYPPKNISTDEEWELAFRFVDYFSISTENLYFRDLQDLYILLKPVEAHLQPQQPVLLVPVLPQPNQDDDHVRLIFPSQEEIHEFED